jgi:hypothetical protein
MVEDEDLKVEGMREANYIPISGSRHTLSGELHVAEELSPSPERELPTNRCLETYSTLPYCIAKAVVDIRLQASNTIRMETVFAVIGTGCFLIPLLRVPKALN